MEGIEGFEFVKVEKARLPVTMLQRREFSHRYGNGSRATKWKTWMVDDPLHWFGMRERVMSLPPGKLLVAGLGLGLFAHHLMARPDITEVLVIEIDLDVINLILPTLPDHPNLTVMQGDFYEFAAKSKGAIWQPDAVLWDLAVGGPDETRGDFYRGLAATVTAFPNAHLSQFGLRDNKQTILG